MRKLTFISLVFTVVVQAQELNVWHVLAEVGYDRRKSPETGFEMESPTFSKRLWSYNGKVVRIKGYLIPMAELGGRNEYMLSSLPFNQCYFCGGAGPETVVEIQTKQTIKFVTRQITLEGVLFLNDFDPDHHMYIIKDAKLID
jgi:hypothetical protein